MPPSWQCLVIGVLLPALTSLTRVRAELLKDLKAECTRDGIKVQLLFKEPFYGVAYSLGHFDSRRCQYIQQNTGSSNYSFLIPAKGCGTLQGESKTRSPVKASAISNGGLAVVQASYSRRKRRTGMERVDNKGNDIFMENTLLVQQDPSIQESSDVAQKLRCVWQKEIHKPLTASFQPLQSASAPAHRTRPHGYGPPRAWRNSTRYSTPAEQQEGFYGVVNPINMQFRPKGQVQAVHAQPHKSSSKAWKNQTRYRTGRSHENLPQLPVALPYVSASSSTVVSLSGVFLFLSLMLV